MCVLHVKVTNCTQLYGWKETQERTANRVKWRLAKWLKLHDTSPICYEPSPRELFFFFFVFDFKVVMWTSRRPLAIWTNTVYAKQHKVCIWKMIKFITQKKIMQWQTAHLHICVCSMHTDVLSSQERVTLSKTKSGITIFLSALMFPSIISSQSGLQGIKATTWCDEFLL